MKLIRVTFLLCEIAILLLLTPTYSQGLSEKMVTKVSSRKLMIISSEHVNVMASTTVHESSNEKLPVKSSSEKPENDQEKKSEEEEKNALSKYFSMDYPKFRRRRPVHNKSLPRTP